MSDSSHTNEHWVKAERLDPFLVLLFIFLHAACLLVFWTGVSWVAVLTCVVLYVVRMFGITAGFHRYFSHRTFKTSRLFQFVLAFIGVTAFQKGVLWWAAHHRRHHAYTDTERDVHSPLGRGFWWSHCGWFLCRRNNETHVKMVPQLMKYRELSLLNDFYMVPPVVLAASTFLCGAALERYAPRLGTSGPQMLVWGFFVSTVLLYHGTFCVNSVTHVFGGRRFETKDNSRNNLWVALITLGEGWHNNHHHLPSSERQGLYWWEIDVSHYVLACLARLGIVWDIQGPPERAYGEARLRTGEAPAQRGECEMRGRPAG